MTSNVSNKPKPSVLSPCQKVLQMNNKIYYQLIIALICHFSLLSCFAKKRYNLKNVNILNIGKERLGYTLVHMIIMEQYSDVLMLSLFSHVQLCATLWTAAFQIPLSMGFSSKITGMGCHVFLQGIFMAQGSNLHLLVYLHWQVGSFTTNNT